MRSVKVKCDELKTRLVVNRDFHIDDYLEMMEYYEIDVERLANELLERVKNRDYSLMTVVATKPESYESDYNAVIEMLEMSVDDEIELSNQEFKQYVMNEWNWKGGFDMLKTVYNSGV